MIVFTTSEIEIYNPTRMSDLEEYYNKKVCLEEVPNDFSLTEEEMLKNGIDFYWECGEGYLDSRIFDYEYYATFGLINGIERTYNISKEKNIAMAIRTLADNIGEDIIELFNGNIFLKKKTI